MKREYKKWWSAALGREMELLVFGNAGLPAIVFPTSCGRFYDFEDFGMVGIAGDKLEHGHLKLVCVDSVDAESWYNGGISPRAKLERHQQYERYVLDEVLPLVRQPGRSMQVAAAGCSFGGYHALNLALRHPEVFTSVLSMGGCFDVSKFLSGYYDDDCYFNMPLHFLPNVQDINLLDQFRRNSYVMSTAVHDPCWNDNERMAAVFKAKQIPCRLDVWGDGTGHDWAAWQKMLRAHA